MKLCTDTHVSEVTAKETEKWRRFRQHCSAPARETHPNQPALQRVVEQLPWLAWSFASIVKTFPIFPSLQLTAVICNGFNTPFMRAFLKTTCRNQRYREHKESLSLATWRKQEPKKQGGNSGPKGKMEFNTVRRIRLSGTQRRCYQLSPHETESYWRCIRWGGSVWRLPTCWKDFWVSQMFRTTFRTHRQETCHGMFCCLSWT